MQSTEKILCPFCSKEIPEPVSRCWHCGSDLHGMKLAPPKTPPQMDRYEVVPDGLKFGIALRGEIKIHGLDLDKARSLLEILNDVADIQEAG